MGTGTAGIRVFMRASHACIAFAFAFPFPFVFVFVSAILHLFVSACPRACSRSSAGALALAEPSAPAYP